jgi:tetratricopeptide (TPR) repeat protein
LGCLLLRGPTPVRVAGGIAQYVQPAERDLDEAIGCLREAIRLDSSDADAHYSLGGALIFKHSWAEAASCLRRSRELAPKWWGNAQELELKRFEESAFWVSKLDAVLEGRETVTAVDRLLCAETCLFDRQDHATAARLFADGLAEQPELTHEEFHQHRYNAACCASLAAAGTSAQTLTESERARWRTQAVEWLRAELGLWARQLDTSDPSVRVLARQTLLHWQSDPDLASLRDPDALERLPESEAAALRSLWAEVKRLTSQAEESAAR